MKRRGKIDQEIPVQPVQQPILCNPYEEPADHWRYEPETGDAKRAGHRRPAGYWYTTEKTGSAQAELFAEEQRDDLPLINRLRDDVRRWREADYRGATNVTKDLLRHWARVDNKPRRLFFCQREAVETVIYLAELAIPGRLTRTGFRQFKVSGADLQRLLRGERPRFHELRRPSVHPSLIDLPADESLRSLMRLGCKMATGSGKTVVMAMLIAWAFCNRGRNPGSRQFPSGVLVCCPKLTVKERLQVLRPEHPDNYYDAFGLVPTKHRPLMQAGKVLVTNWHTFAPQSPHKEGDRTYSVVNKGPETPQDFARRVLGDMAERMPIMIFNDEGHHCWRPAAESDEEGLSGEEKKAFKAEKEKATVWVEGLDRLNNVLADGPGISFCLDLSATPFYIQGSGHPQGYPFPWLVSDFGLVDAIESGIVKIPRLPVKDTTGRPEPKYFRLWHWIKKQLQPGERLPDKSGTPKPEVVWRESQGAVQQLADQWVERFRYMQEATPGQEHVPPVLIIVCDNADLAEVFHHKISGERREEVATEADMEEADAGNTITKKRGGKPGKKRMQTVYGRGEVYPDYLSNTSGERSGQRTIRIDTKLLTQAESGESGKSRAEAAEHLRRVVATVGKRGEPGEHVRCVVSVDMLTEGWDANNVTHILGVRAFGSQLLCEQVVGRGLRRMDYTPDPKTGLLTEEYVDVYGIPFSVIPFKGRPNKPVVEDKPKNHVRALPERKQMMIRFPVVEGYAFALRRNLIRCDVDSMQGLVLEPGHEPTATFVQPTIGYREGSTAQQTGEGLYEEQNRQTYYEHTHPQAIQFQIAWMVLDRLMAGEAADGTAKRRVLRLQSRHQLFPQVYRYVREYVARKVNFQDCHPCELGLQRYAQQIVGRLADAIEPDEAEGEPPLMPVLNRYHPTGSTDGVSFRTTRPCHATRKSHINQVAADTREWEQTAAFRLEQSDAVEYYARNEGMEFVVPYEYYGIEHSYEPDFLVRLTNGQMVVLEVKGYEDNQDRAKHEAARRWVSAVNNWGELGQWRFHVCRNPQRLGADLQTLSLETSVGAIEAA